MVREMLPLAEIYVYEDDYTKQIDGFITLFGLPLKVRAVKMLELQKENNKNN